ncbi:MAG TPA: glutamate synthase large subunit [Gemmatimonadaceae bacterium]
MSDRPTSSAVLAVPTVPERQGLYDPAQEHDACGIGFVAHTHGTRSRDVVTKALTLLTNLSHRSATGADPGTGDGAGILLQIPHAFLRRECAALGIGLPDAGSYGVGMLFLPTDEIDRRWCETAFERAVADETCRVLGWRDVPLADQHAGADARSARPAIRQVFVARAALDVSVDDSVAFERALYRMRKRFESAVAGAGSATARTGYVASLSARTVVYKGMLRPDQLGRVYPDLADEMVISALAVVHSRFSTNTFPSWNLAHPFRMICHNGEINTLRGNLNWMRVREPLMRSTLSDDLPELFPVIAEGQSDSASLDNALELLVAAGRPLTHAMMMLIPEAWEGDPAMDAERRAFYDYHASLMEPWDGPAAIVFTDGRQIGATLDRNGLRPARYIVTDDDLVILASEAGAVDVPVENIRAKGRLQPGRMLLVNTTQGRVLDDEEIKSEVVTLRPYRRWVDQQRAAITPAAREASHRDDAELAQLQRAFGYTREELSMILTPMAAAGEEPVGSMGNDTPLAVLSDRPRLLFSYFRQQFAQVTNPAIDPIRERLVMSLSVRLGPVSNLLEEAPEHAHHLRLERPVITDEQLAAIEALQDDVLRPRLLQTLFAAADGPRALRHAVGELCLAAEAAVRDGCGILVLSDRGVNANFTAIPALLALGAVHHHLIRARLRGRASIVVDTGEAREVAHIALLVAYGASAVNPYLAFESVDRLARTGALPEGVDPSRARESYIHAIDKGMLKVLSKMGISTVQSYCGAQLCEAVGLDRTLVDEYFTGTASRIGGMSAVSLGVETLRRHHAAWNDAPRTREPALAVGGDYHYRAAGEQHLWNPRTISTLQHATRSGSFSSFKEFSREADANARGFTLRGVLDVDERAPVPIEEVEPAAAIVRRFVTGAMSFGSLSREAHETLAIAMNQLGGRSNTGEGGEERERFGTNRSSAVKQVASARFGVTAEYLVNANELQIKIAQGAKPGEGGQLPGHKVDETIARTRCSTPGVTLISPPPHHDIYSIEDLAQLIHDLRRVNPRARISVKLVAAAGVGTIAAGVAKAGADVVVISGDSGGTGASPLSSIKHAGVPWELGLAEAQQTLILSGLRSRVRVQTDGQLKTGRDVIVAALLGADEFGFATAPLIAEGCVMMRKCHLNTCPVGVATQDPELRAKFSGKPEYVVNYFFFVAEEVREHLARLGARTLAEVVGHAELLRPTIAHRSEKSATLRLDGLLHRPLAREPVSGPLPANTHRHDDLDATLLTMAAPALERGERVSARIHVSNVNRAVGTALSGEIARRHGAEGLPDDTVTFRLTGSAGQSFGAFAARGLTLELSGEANDYVGKGLSGGRLIVRAPQGAKYLPQRTIIVGNTALYGATSGEAYIGGLAGERFAVRNSGAHAVVEGVGDHGCEYMTGGAVVVLGPTGRNFAAGMSGGLAFVLDDAGTFASRCNTGMVDLVPVVDGEDRALLRRLVEHHAHVTGSAQAKLALAHWEHTVRKFVCVIPRDFKRVRDLQRAEVAARQEGTRRG